MKINYTLDSNNRVTSWTAIPYNPEKPHIEVNNPTDIILKHSTIVGGVLHINRDKYNHAVQKANKKRTIESEILKENQFLASTDYIIIKDYEGLMTSEEEKQKVIEIKKQRAAAREKINKLQHDLKNNNY